MTEVYPDLTDKVISALYKFVALANTMLKNNGEGVEAWTATRWEDFVITLQWYGTWWYLLILVNEIRDRLYDNHPNGNEDLLLETMKLLKWTGVPWEKVFSQQVTVDEFLRQDSALTFNLTVFPDNGRWVAVVVSWCPLDPYALLIEHTPVRAFVFQITDFTQSHRTHSISL